MVRAMAEVKQAAKREYKKALGVRLYMYLFNLKAYTQAGNTNTTANSRLRSKSYFGGDLNFIKRGILERDRIRD